MVDQENVSFRQQLIDVHGKKMHKACVKAEQKYDAQDPGHQRRSKMHEDYPHKKR